MPKVVILAVTRRSHQLIDDVLLLGSDGIGVSKAACLIVGKNLLIELRMGMHTENRNREAKNISHTSNI